MNYDEIKSAALSYADRNDDEVIDRMDDFLRVVESRMNRILDVQQQAQRVQYTGVVDQVYYGLPGDFKQLRSIAIKDTAADTDKGQHATYLNPDMFATVETGADGWYYTIIDQQFQIAPDPGGKIIELVYYRRIVALDSTNDNNWISNGNPDAYIFGLLVEINAFVKDPDGAKLWNERFTDTLKELESDDSRNRWSGTQLRTVLA